MEEKFELRVKVNDKLDTALTDYCKKYDVTKAHVVRMSLFHYLEERNFIKNVK